MSFQLSCVEETQITGRDLAPTEENLKWVTVEGRRSMVGPWLTWIVWLLCAEASGGSGETSSKIDGRSQQQGTDMATANGLKLKLAVILMSVCGRGFVSHRSGVDSLMFLQLPLSGESGPAVGESAVEQL